ncbi:RNA polymerase-binding protein RbpA [Actinospica durhamensis]|uniref:RNA polymerase-binding protein RbpA n=1 Tax=Actinospica durhamensis TaxID=1508375 RepID=A0A941IT75_9ACTN|nr:RNA polymerase-binding protein RbpA [Actinospica durhamensis]MBR7835678.1 RNA polymerase-binding protein RbpA [Actinospica durhamensis]
MARSSGVRGHRIGSGPAGESERGGDLVARVLVTFWCASGHSTPTRFAAEAVVPEEWECHRCGMPAGQDQENPPAATRVAPYKTHLAYVRERRSDADAEILLAQALAKLRGTAS